MQETHQMNPETVEVLTPEVINVGDYQSREKPIIVDSPERSTAIAPANPMMLIQLAIENNVDVERLSKLMDLQTAWEDREAKKSFARSFAECQNKMPRVIKNKINKQTDSSYADLEVVNSTIMPVATAHGFSVSFSEGGEWVDGKQIPKKPEDIRTVMILRHRDGHTETHFYDLPTDMTGIAGKANKTAVHGKASSTSYAERYLFCQVFSITIAGHDNDGNNDLAKLTEEQVRTLREKMDACIEAGVDLRESQFFSWVSQEQKSEVRTLDEMNQKLFTKAASILDAKLRNHKKSVQS